MHGYWRNPDAETARALQNGWLHTGDIGHIDSAGRLK
jgi:long-chain acyl-CoA synthetase